MKTLLTAADVDPLAEAIAETVVAWAGDGPVDWQDMLDRLEWALDLDLGSDLQSPAIRRIQTIGRQALKEARS